MNKEDVYFLLKISLAVVILVSTFIFFLIDASPQEQERLLYTYESLNSKPKDSNGMFDKKLAFLSNLEDKVKREIKIVSPTGKIMSGKEYEELMQEESQEEIDEQHEEEQDTQNNMTVPVDGDLKEFIASNAIDFSSMGISKTKQEAFLAMYYTLNKEGYSNQIISGILGNIAAEGNISQFEGIPYGYYTEDCQYYKNSWACEAIYKQFPNKSGGKPEREYSTTYSNKQAFNINGLTLDDLRKMLSIDESVATFGNKAVFGFGTIQATVPSKKIRYVTVIDSLGNLNAAVTQDICYVIEAGGVKNTALAVFPDKTSIPDECSNLKNNGNTYDKIISAVGVDDPALKDVCKVAAYWGAGYEVFYGFKKLDKLAGRANLGCQAYQCIKKAGF